ncbi:mucin-5AC isoform X3 [Melopsittacus undulatus]|uniref:mucin-5AC isoform X3 n=1 Tax=Melopsittacus undulatus TaxID=13146 RepID=UPI00146E837F|nr:mucin-20 isoform X3 [Melopsittacus undulatus]
MAGQRGGLPLLLLSIAVLDLTLATAITDVTATMSTSVPTSPTPTETSALLPTTDPTTAATLPPSSPESSTLERSSTLLGTSSFSSSTMPPVTAASSPSSPEISTLERSSTLLGTSSFSPSTMPTVTAATLPPSSPDTSTTGAFTASTVPLRSSMAASSITTPQVTGSTSHSTPDGTSVLPEPTETELGLTTSTLTPAPAATTSSGTDPTIVTSVGTGTTSAVISFGVEKSTLSLSTSDPLSSTGAGTTFGITTRQEPAVATLLGSTSLGTGSASFPTAAAAPTVTSDEPHWTTSDTTATAVTSTGGPGNTPTQPVEPTAGTTAGSSAAATAITDVTATMSTSVPTSPTPTETSALLPTTDPTTAATLPPSSPESSTLERSSTLLGTSSFSSSTMPPVTKPAPTVASAEPLTTLADSTAIPFTSTDMSSINPTSRTTHGNSNSPLGSTPGTSAVSGTLSAATGASHLFLSLRLTVPLDLGNTTVQELLLSKLRGDLQTAFPCAGLAVAWRGKRRT